MPILWCKLNDQQVMIVVLLGRETYHNVDTVDARLNSQSSIFKVASDVRKDLGLQPKLRDRLTISS